MPLDLDSSPWRRWSPILFDLTIAVLLIHIEIALLHAFFPGGVDAGGAVPRVVLFFDQLAMPGLVQIGWWLQTAALLILLLLIRAGISVAGWHRVAFFPLALALPAAAHLQALDRLV